MLANFCLIISMISDLFLSVLVALWIDFVGMLKQKCQFWDTFSGLGRLGGTSGNKVAKRTSKKRPKDHKKAPKNRFPTRSPHLLGSLFLYLRHLFAVVDLLVRRLFLGTCFVTVQGPFWSPKGTLNGAQMGGQGSLRTVSAQIPTKKGRHAIRPIIYYV